jgi:3-hydroxyacyl-[acyl-carrier-protein] dehydratase
MTAGWTLGEVLSRDQGAVGTVWIDPADAVFAGHYPGFPVLPGLYLVDFTHQTARARLGEHAPAALDAIESCRFLRPVYPGDELTIDISLSHSGDVLRCSGTVSTPGGPVADIRLRYRWKGRI